MTTQICRWHTVASPGAMTDAACARILAARRKRSTRVAASAWLEGVGIPPAQIHPIPAERGAAERWRRGEVIPATAITPEAGVDILIDFRLGKR